MDINLSPKAFIEEVFATALEDFAKNSTKGTLQRRPHTIIIDIRGEEEYSEGHIPTAENVPFQFLDDYMKQLDKKAHADDTFYFFCWAGNTSQIAAMIAKNYGYSAKSIEGGANGWMWSDLPLVR